MRQPHTHSIRLTFACREARAFFTRSNKVPCSGSTRGGRARRQLHGYVANTVCVEESGELKSDLYDGEAAVNDNGFTNDLDLVFVLCRYQSFNFMPAKSVSSLLFSSLLFSSLRFLTPDTAKRGA